MRRTRLTVALTAAAAAAVVSLPTAAYAAPGHGHGQGHGPHPGPRADIPVQLIAMNDFHGRIQNTAGADAQLITAPGTDGAYGTADDVSTTVGGSANVASAVQAAQASFRAENGESADSYFVGAGDLISASPFESSVYKDEPTIEVLNAMGLDVSSVGNHEFDRGTDELRRITAPTDGTYTDDIEACEGVTPEVDGCYTDSTGNPFHGTDYPYLAANVISKETGEPMLPPYQVYNLPNGKKLGLIGVTTETTSTLVSPDGIQDVTFIDEADAINRWASFLQRRGVEAIGVLVHEGGTQTGPDALDPNGCDTLTGPLVDINNRTSNAVDLIVSAHTHQAYNCLLPVPGGDDRLVTSAGFYGRLVSDIRLTINGRSGDVDRTATYQATNVPVTRDNPDAAVQKIVDYWVSRTAEARNRVAGTATADILRARNGAAVVRDRESSLGNLVATMQLDAFNGPVVAFMNPGGLRTDISAGEVTVGELFDVQPFANLVDAVTLTGADIKQLLEQQFPITGVRTTQLWLGTSEGFAYSYDPARAEGDRIDACSIAIDGVRVDPATSYRVVANSFLIPGGDSFAAFTNGVDVATGPVDVDTAVSYFQQNSPVAPPAPDHATLTTQRVSC